MQLNRVEMERNELFVDIIILIFFFHHTLKACLFHAYIIVKPSNLWKFSTFGLLFCNLQFGSYITNHDWTQRQRREDKNSMTSYSLTRTSVRN